MAYRLIERVVGRLLELPQHDSRRLACLMLVCFDLIEYVSSDSY